MHTVSCVSWLCDFDGGVTIATESDFIWAQMQKRCFQEFLNKKPTSLPLLNQIQTVEKKVEDFYLSAKIIFASNCRHIVIRKFSKVL